MLVTSTNMCSMIGLLLWLMSRRAKETGPKYLRNPQLPMEDLEHRRRIFKDFNYSHYP